jgi:hypothetical protein
MYGKGPFSEQIEWWGKPHPTSGKADPTSGKAHPTSDKAHPMSDKTHPTSGKAHPTSGKYGPAGCCLLLMVLVARFAATAKATVETDPNRLAEQQIAKQTSSEPNRPMQSQAAEASSQGQGQKAEPAGQSRNAEQALRKGTLLFARSPSTETGRQLWKSRVASTKETESGKRDELKRLIAQVRSVRFKVMEKEPNLAVAREQRQVTEPAKVDVNIPEIKQLPAGDAMPKPGVKGTDISEHTLEVLRKQLEDPNAIKEPFELAETLFASNHLKEAAVAYQLAYARTDPNDPNLAGKRAWILIQTGNCLKDSEPAKAIASYRRLIEQYPDSPWADLAKALGSMTSWFEQDKPRTLIEQVQRAAAGN